MSHIQYILEPNKKLQMSLMNSETERAALMEVRVSVSLKTPQVRM